MEDLEKSLVEYDGRWYKRGKDGNSDKFTMEDLKELIYQVKQEKDKEYADFSERMNKALFEEEKKAKQEERERILKELPKEKECGYKRTEQEPSEIEKVLEEGFNDCLKQIKDILRDQN